MAHRHDASIRRGKAVAGELDDILAAAYADVARRLHDEPDPVARARAVTSLVRAGETHFSEHLAPLRAEVVRAMRFPAGYRDGAEPAAGWSEIGSAIGTNGNRAYQIAALPSDRAVQANAGKTGQNRKSSVDVTAPPAAAHAGSHPGRTAACGTMSGYVAHLTAGEVADEACRVAWAAWFSERYASDPTYRSKKLQLNAERKKALDVLAANHPDDFRVCWHNEPPGARRNARALEELRKRHQGEFGSMLADIRSTPPSAAG